MITVLFAALAADLVVEDLTPCDGAEKAGYGTSVTVHYTGWVQGQEEPFDSSLERDPLTFPVGAGQVIPGWEKGLEGMTPGCKRRFLIPPELGYGDKARGPIPAGSTLRFEVELLSVAKARMPQKAPSEVPMFITAESGVQYFDLEVGEGPKPVPGQTVTVEYTLWLADGTLVDSSYKRKTPFSYVAGRSQVIKGWEEAVLDMQVGGLRQFKVPYKLGYGARGRPPSIPPKAELTFEVRLIEVK